jgi:hypothetical protein
MIEIKNVAEQIKITFKSGYTVMLTVKPTEGLISVSGDNGSMLLQLQGICKLHAERLIEAFTNQEQICATCANFDIDMSKGQQQQYWCGGNIMGTCKVMAQKIGGNKSDLPLIQYTDHCGHYCFDPAKQADTQGESKNDSKNHVDHDAGNTDADL